MEGEVLEVIVRGLLRPLILWFLLKKAMHGYEIVNQLTEMTGHKFSPGTVYPILYRLEEAGLISGEWEQKTKRRRIKLYRLTTKGLSALRHFKEIFSRCFDHLFKDVTDLSQNLYTKVAKKKTKKVNEVKSIN